MASRGKLLKCRQESDGSQCITSHSAPDTISSQTHWEVMVAVERSLPEGQENRVTVKFEQVAVAGDGHAIIIRCEKKGTGRL